MYEYKFINLELKGLFESVPKEDYHKIIQDHGKEGWRLVQVVTPPTGADGTATHFELIFERAL